MTCGWCLPHGTDYYLYIGIPLVLIFQRGIAKQPLRRLWVRADECKPFRFDRTGFALVLVLMAVPALNLTKNLHSWNLELAFISSFIGVIPAAFALRRQTKEGLSRGMFYFSLGIVMSFMYSATFAIIYGRSILFSLEKIPLFADQFFVMFTQCFVEEEVVFRGDLDTYLAPPVGDPAKRWTSAVFVSALWGLWHVPLNHPTLRELPLTVVLVIFASVLIGVPLSLCWRRSGTLVLPSAAHALADCYRNMVA
jgi:membrane protease YdiL (CAAX protease family)